MIRNVAVKLAAKNLIRVLQNTEEISTIEKLRIIEYLLAHIEID
jgi:hypothetical protein